MHGDGQQPAALPDHGPEPVQQPQIVGVVGVQRLQIQMDASEPVRPHLTGACHDRPAGRGIREAQPAPLIRLVHQPVAQPGVYPHRRQGPVQRADQPPRPRIGATGRWQGAVMLQRPGVDVQIADSGAFDPPPQRGHIGGVPPPVHPGVPQPECIPPPGRRLRSGRPRVLGAQRRARQRHRQHDQHGDCPGRPLPRTPPSAQSLPSHRHPPVDASRCTSSQPPLTVTTGPPRSGPAYGATGGYGDGAAPVDRPIVTRCTSP